MTSRVTRVAALQRPVWRAQGRVLRITGRLSIGVGVLVLLLVGCLLWGTGHREARAQERVRREFSRATEEPLRSEAVAAQRRGSPAVTVVTTTTTVAPPPPRPGTPIAVLRIPRIGLDKVVVEGTETADLELGPGHYPTTPPPGDAGNVGIAGHRTTYGAPFFRLDELQPGDEVLLTTLDRTYRYVVSASSVVRPNAAEVLAPTNDNRITLTTCEPRYSSRFRLVVTALLDGPASDASPSNRPL